MTTTTAQSTGMPHIIAAPDGNFYASTALPKYILHSKIISNSMPRQTIIQASSIPSLQLPSYSAAVGQVQDTDPIDVDNNIEDDDDANDNNEDLSAPIHISIKCPTRIVGNGNVVHVDEKYTSQTLTSAIVAALQETCLYDENGNVRPLHLDIDAAVTVEGTRNVVGRFMRRVNADGTAGVKRRAESEPTGTEVKRTRPSPPTKA